ncbi:CONSTANS-like 4 [Forsythia ovata]|uniref:CONSTANS-like 4 n=1 Tax=Forsythia ovata TaxID=205694 RepID=A0ABD1WFF7_9LAMI
MAATPRCTTPTSCRPGMRGCWCVKCASKRPPSSPAKPTQRLFAPPVTVIYTLLIHLPVATNASQSSPSTRHPRIITINDNKYFSEDEAEAASWLLPTPHTKGGTIEEDDPDSPKYKPGEYLFDDMDPYLDLDIISGDQKQQHHMNDQKQCQYMSSDGVVPVQNKNDFQGSVVDGFPTYDMDYNNGSKPFLYNFTSQSISQSVSSSSLEVGVVPDPGAMTDVSNTLVKQDGIPNPVTGLDREARVLRYREKKKNRKFEKTIRYASRKAYAETRPRIKGRFAKRSENGVESLMVPTF